MRYRVILARFLVIAAASASPLAAQRARLSAISIGQIVDAVLDTLVPPSAKFSGVPVAKRGLVFDYEETMSSFQKRGSSRAPFTALRMRTTVLPTTRAILQGCSQLTPMRCERLGWKVFLAVQATSVSDTLVNVRVILSWADRSRAGFREGVAPTDDTFLTGFAATVFVVRPSDGAWRASRIGTIAAGD